MRRAVSAFAVVFGCCHLLIVRLGASDRTRLLPRFALAAQAALTFLIPVLGGVAWLGLGSYLIGSLGIPPRPRERVFDSALSEGTVRNYTSNMINKCGARNRVDLVRIAYERGWL